MKKTIRTLVLTSACFIVVQHEIGAAAEVDPATSASTSVIQYQSPFKNYRSLGEDKRIPWKAANDEVGKIGGWRVYAREASVDNSSSESKPAGPPSKPGTEPGTAVSPESTPVDKLGTEPSAKPTVKPMPMDHTGHASHGQPK